ncbi:immunity repressor [Mycobacterium phage Zetzy]|uniref:Immunity repressor n=1 Tax=Mycobacterium phage Zetzy TaxID=2499071 RepID=A0A3S9UP84_9CAUD|nr:transcriptional repressor [Mycobacterium phage Zetzy]AZS12046.1 immunity repressor [Mycobacterium phage Zetzy]
MDGKTAKMQKQVAKLLRHAEDVVGTPEEAVFMAKAFELIAKYGLDMASIQADKQGLDTSDMPDEKLKRLRSFYRKLRDEGLVLEFDPNIPPIEGVSAQGGWRFVEATSEERESGILIRENEHSRLTEKGRMIWRFPPREP